MAVRENINTATEISCDSVSPAEIGGLSALKNSIQNLNAEYTADAIRNKYPFKIFVFL
jgi:hypothetical protein